MKQLVAKQFFLTDFTDGKNLQKTQDTTGKCLRNRNNTIRFTWSSITAWQIIAKVFLQPFLSLITYHNGGKLNAIVCYVTIAPAILSISHSGPFCSADLFCSDFDVLKLAFIKIQKSTESQLILSVANIVENVFAERKERVYAGGGHILKRTDLFTAHFPFATLGCC